MPLLRGARSVKGIGRFGTITRVLIKHGFGGVIDRLFRGNRKSTQPADTPAHLTPAGSPLSRRIRLALQELGPSFIKLGQLMSTRADVFPPAYIEEFKKLQDQVPPIPFEAVRKVVEAELGQPLDEVFERFEPTAMAAASVAQVHVGYLKNGPKVAVKVIRPGIEKTIRQDIGLMYHWATRIEKTFEIGRVVGAVNIVKEFERTIFRELDMYVEAGSMEKFIRNFRDHGEIHIPRVYWDHTSRHVLVMEHIAGIKMDQVAQIRANGLDPKEVAMIGLRSFSKQLMEFGLFHADPHPANTIVMFDGRVALVDFGITGYLDDEMMRHVANVFLGYAEHDYDMVINAFTEAGLISDEMAGSTAFRNDLKDISEPFYGRSLKTISVREVYDQIMDLVLKYRIRLPRNLLLLFKTIIQTEALGKILGSDASLLEVTRPYAQNLLQRGYDARKLFRTMGSDARTLGQYVRLMPRLMRDILKQAARGRYRLEIFHSGFQKIDTKLEKGINRLTVGIIISASTIAASLILNSGQHVFDIPFTFFGLNTISVTALLGLIGYSIATVLGLWLIISIFRSGKM